MKSTAEHERLIAHYERRANWRNWGPYLSERAWGTVREDYSNSGDAWGYFPHHHSHSRAYRWNEDGLAGISDRNQYICFALALWNENDPILKERLFGLSNPEGNHGEDVKEYYFYLDNTPTHSYMKMLYKYPHSAFPYAELIEENAQRGFQEMEYELIDTGVFDEDAYFDVIVEYAKATQEDVLAKITVINRGAKTAPCHILPTLWFRNTWSWGYKNGPMADVVGKPLLYQADDVDGASVIEVNHPANGIYYWYCDTSPQMLFTDNETNHEVCFGIENASPYVKDAFHRYVIYGEQNAINPDHQGTKSAAHYQMEIEPDAEVTIRIRLTNQAQKKPFQHFESIFTKRFEEADAFYDAIHDVSLDAEQRQIQRQAFAGMLWTKQLYYYDIEQWIEGDSILPRSADSKHIRNNDWLHLHNFDVISMPDKWEYPWYATWDLAFHCIPFVLIDPGFAKRQLTLMTREWYMHPNGQLPAYEWEFGDVNPPVHAWATWRVYKIDEKQTSKPDRKFLKSIYLKLLLNFTSWVNKKDRDGNNVFQGGFLGMDNISVFDRSADLPIGGHIDQSDGTAWMGFYSLVMLKMSLELAQDNPIYQDMATKFFEHFLAIANAIANRIRGQSLWDEEDGFFYDWLHLPNAQTFPLKVRSLVGLMPLIAVETIEPELMNAMEIFGRRVDWFTSNRPHLAGNMASVDVPGEGKRKLFSIVTKDRLERVLAYMFDENEFLSDYGIRSLSKYHESHPYTFHAGNSDSFHVKYTPAESDSGLFGGNSNWRGPIWFPLNYLLIESLQKFHHYYGDDFKVDFPTGSGNEMNLWDISIELSRRLIRIFLRDEEGTRPVFGGTEKFQTDPHWRDHILFYEYFHGDNGAGLGASHQTGWTGLIAKLLQQSGGEI